MDNELFITQEYTNELEQEMLAAAGRLQFELAATLRDRIEELKKHIGKHSRLIEFPKRNSGGRGKRGRNRGREVPKPEK